ncbi:DDE superfamily endonuclease [Ceratobasidium sp. AG-Ba]|nr:DDE superfamily endonuclease [Ceratobasidium sp. AG-Ba]QRW12043.1 DDE superfamily endonuclease [Ceratobasidium sp. AG-Ba]
MVYHYIEKPVKGLMPQMQAQIRSAEVASLIGVSQRTVQRTVRLYHRTGSVIWTPIKVGQPRRLSNLEASFLEGCILRKPDMYTRELQDALHHKCGIRVSESTVLRALHLRGFTRKQVSRQAAERDPVDRDLYEWVIGTAYRAEQLVFVDESSCDQRTPQRRFAWALSGHRATLQTSTARGRRYSILPALSLDGILHCVIREGAYTGETFMDFICGLLDEMNPFPGCNSVVIMDNASIHKSTALRELVEIRGMRLIYLPAYSPDLNPIEEAFSSIKAWMRRNHQTVTYHLSGAPGADPMGTLLSAVYSVTPEQARAWYRDSNYVM